MIIRKDNLFVLDGDKVTYAFEVMENGYLEHLYFGRKIAIEDALPLREKREFPEGNAISYSREFGNVSLENVCLEMSGVGKGDIREPFVEIEFSDGSSTCDFIFSHADIIDEKEPVSGLPFSYDEKHQTKSLVVTLKERSHEVYLCVTYTMYENCNVVTRSSSITNKSEDVIRVKRLMSNQIDFDENNFVFTNFTGAWTREMNRNDTLVSAGKVVNESRCGFSSNRNNPFVMMSKKGCTDYFGECYGFNLVYSGNHYEAAEVNGYGKTRFVSGINPFGFSYKLSKGETFNAPEAVMTYSDEGFMDMSHNMHEFVREHIVRGKYKHENRPVLINSWETAYFKFNESKLLKLAKASKEAGVELFVLDDGWFGVRNADNCSLGDWTENKEKLPKGLKGLCEKINALGMKFGIWVEPEMVNEDSDCYRNHPDFAVKIGENMHSEGRNQMLLDLTRSDVCEYVIQQMRYVFSQGNIEYVKWDMNRVFSDAYSVSLETDRQGEFFYRYITGLYGILQVLTSEFPNILFESCASGGNRFDLGMMCYMPQVWASDNTDPLCRCVIQEGLSYGYPMSVAGSHVSSSPNHQTLRRTPLETRFNVASAALLGYELNLAELPKADFEAVKEQIKLYKEYINTIQYGTYYRLGHEDGVYKWIVVSKDKETAVGVCVNTMTTPNKPYLKFVTKGLDENYVYDVKNISVPVDIRDFGSLVNTVSPIHLKEDSFMMDLAAKFVNFKCEDDSCTASGSLLNHAGIKLSQGYAGTGFDDKTRIFKDFDSRMYIFNRKK